MRFSWIEIKANDALAEVRILSFHSRTIERRLFRPNSILFGFLFPQSRVGSSDGPGFFATDYGDVLVHPVPLESNILNLPPR